VYERAAKRVSVARRRVESCVVLRKRLKAVLGAKKSRVAWDL
jgi:hypothetical protein